MISSLVPALATTALLGQQLTPYRMPSAPFTVECDLTYTSEQNFTWGPRYGRNTHQRKQRFRIDPAARTITTTFGEGPNSTWIEAPKTYPIKLVTPMGRIVWCTRDDGKCPGDTTTTDANGRTVSFTSRQDILNLAASTYAASNVLMVSARDGSEYIGLAMSEGDCRNV